jgi:hypothetical protein
MQWTQVVVDGNEGCNSRIKLPVKYMAVHPHCIRASALKSPVLPPAAKLILYGRNTGEIRAK